MLTPLVRTVTGRPWLLALIAVPALGTPAPDPLYLPRAVQSAYRKGTRSPDGRPGAGYWQNRARYSITVTALPPDRGVTGTEEIVYANHSPDTLKSLVIKLFLNVHKPGAPRLWGATEDYETSGVHIDAFAVNGQARPWGDDSHTFSWKRVRLPTALLPLGFHPLGVRLALRCLQGERPRRRDRSDDVLSRLLLSAGRRV
jgi:hypothetical protein